MLYFKFHGCGTAADVKTEPEEGFIAGDFESTVLLRYKLDTTTGTVIDEFAGIADEDLDAEIIRRINARNAAMQPAE